MLSAWLLGQLALAGPRCVERETLVLLDRVAQEREAHLREEPARLVDLFASDMVMIDEGAVRPVEREQALQRFANYFGRVEFLAWDDLAPPRVSMSRDCTLATVVVEKDVQTRFLDDKGTPMLEHTRFAWLETWARREGTWKIIAVASTRLELPTQERGDR
jgi:hypothetical protein